MENNFSYFQNKDCIYFPCHKTDSEFFNCLFCYCPLYALGDKCGGNFTYIDDGADGIKDCSGCMVPHCETGYSYVISKYPEVAALAAKNRGK